MPRPPASARLPPEALEACRLAARLHGKPVYLVGGALRDLFLGRPLADVDVQAAREGQGEFVIVDV